MFNAALIFEFSIINAAFIRLKKIMHFYVSCMELFSTIQKKCRSGKQGITVLKRAPKFMKRISRFIIRTQMTIFRIKKFF